MWAATTTNTASLTLPAGVTDPDTSNNTATDTDTVLAALIAIDDSASGISAATGGTAVLNVFANDTLNGSAATTSNATVALASGSSVPGGLTFDTATGNVDVAAGIAPGTYTFDYTLCESANPTNCTDATVSVTVVGVVMPVTDSGTGKAFTASTVLSDVRANDTVNGAAATSANSTISTDPTSGHELPAGFSLNTSTGEVSIDSTVAAGSYDVWYQLCDTSTPANCAVVKDTVTISNRQADLVLTKTNNETSLTSGQTTSYVLTVTNNGPDSVTGVVVKDSPGTGLTCPTTNPLVFGGTGGIPAGAFTVAELTGTGVTLGALADGQSVTVTYECTVD